MSGEWLLVTQFAAAVLMLALAGWLLWLDAANGAVRAFVAFLFLRAGIILATRFAALGGPGAVAALDSALNYYNIALVAAVVWLLSLYPRRRGLGARRWGFPLLVGLTLASEAAYALDHCLVRCLDGETFVYGPLFLLTRAVPLVAGVGAAVLFLDARREPSPHARTSLVLLATGLAAEAAVAAGISTGLIAAGGASADARFLALLSPLAAALVALAGLAAARLPRATVARVLAALAVFSAMGATTAVEAWRDAAVPLFLSGIARLALPVLAAYALARHRLFGIDLRVRIVLRGTTIGAMFAAVFFVVTEGAAYYLGNLVGVLAGILAAGAIVPLFSPIQRLAHRLVDAATGAPVAFDDLPLEERRNVYRDFAMRAWRDGNLASSERRFLDELRARLALPADDVLTIESEAASRSDTS